MAQRSGGGTSSASGAPTWEDPEKKPEVKTGISGIVDDVNKGDGWAPVKAFVDPSNKNFGPKAVMRDLGITNAPPDSAAEGEDAARARGFGDHLRNEYATTQGYNPREVVAARLNQQQANEARGLSSQNIQRSVGVADGTTPTAANALMTQGTDQAASRARGLAAAYSRSNPGAAMRAGLAAGNQAQQAATAQAAQLKAQEQAQARGEIGAQANAMRAGDLGAATTNLQTYQDTQKSNQAAELAANQQNNQFKLGVGQLANQATEMPLKAASEHEKAVTANNAANQQGIGGVAGALGSLFGGSDERMKEGVNPRALADAYADKIKHGVTYHYKPKYGDPDEKHTGILAQDVEKVVPGAIHRDKDGMRNVDAFEMTMSNTGVIAELAARVKDLEKRGKASKRKAA